MRRQEILTFLEQHLPELRKRFGIREFLVFGSVARDEDRPASDLDLLVEFEGCADFDRFMGLRFFLEDHLGINVDLVTSKALRPAMRQAIAQEAIHVA